MLPRPQHALPSSAALPDDELASRLARLLPSLDGETRGELLRALFPVPSVGSEEATTTLVSLAIERVHSDGLLKARAAEFIARRPHLLGRIRRSEPDSARSLVLSEALGWILAAVAVALVCIRALGAPTMPESQRTSHTFAGTQATPLPPPLEWVFGARHARRITTNALAPQPAHAAAAGVKAAVAAVLPRPHRTPFHNVSFSGYFNSVHHATRTAAVESRPTPQPSPTAQPRPRVHSLFGPLFGPHVH